MDLPNMEDFEDLNNVIDSDDEEIIDDSIQDMCDMVKEIRLHTNGFTSSMFDELPHNIRNRFITQHDLLSDYVKKMCNQYDKDLSNKKKKDKRYDEMKKNHPKIINDIQKLISFYDHPENGKLYSILKVFGTTSFFKLLYNISSLMEISELIDILSNTDLDYQYKEVLVENDLNFEKEVLDISLMKDEKNKTDIQCPCGKPHINHLMLYGDVKDNKMLIFGDDCINRILSILYLIDDKTIYINFLKRTLDSKHKKKEKQKELKKIREEEKIKQKEQEAIKKRIENQKMWEKQELRMRHKRLVLCLNFNPYKKELNKCESLIDSCFDEYGNCKVGVWVPYNSKYPNRCQLCWDKHHRDK